MLTVCHCCCFIGCFVHGLYLEGAAWDLKKNSLLKQKPKQLIQALPVLKIIPIEAHRLKLQVGVTIAASKVGVLRHSY